MLKIIWSIYDSIFFSYNAVIRFEYYRSSTVKLGKPFCKAKLKMYVSPPIYNGHYILK